MSTTIRILAASFGAALFAVLYYGVGIAWYAAILAGIAVFWLFTICQEKLANQQSGRRLRAIIKRRIDSEK